MAATAAAKRGLVSLAIAGLLVGAAGCSSSSDTTADKSTDTSAMSPSMSPGETTKSSDTAPEGDVAVIEIKDFEFSGPDSVTPGAQVMVKNDDSTNHTVTAADDGGFDVTVEAGLTAMFTAPSKPGNYPYVCNFHADMMSTLVVK